MMALACDGDAMGPVARQHSVVIGAEVGPVRAFTSVLSAPLRAAVPTAAAMVAREGWPPT